MNVAVLGDDVTQQRRFPRRVSAAQKDAHVRVGLLKQNRQVKLMAFVARVRQPQTSLQEASLFVISRKREQQAPNADFSPKGIQI